MKNTYLFYTLFLFTAFVYAQEPFITTWQGGHITIVVIEDDDIPDNYTIDFGDGTVLTNQSGTIGHTYSDLGIYTVSMSGNFTRIDFSFQEETLVSIEQWGDIQWTSMHKAFMECDHLQINATDNPDLSQVTDMSYMFMESLHDPINQDLSQWDVSNVTNMARMFDSSYFNQPLDSWDVSNVTNMDGMFLLAYDFNQDLSSWNFNSNCTFNAFISNSTFDTDNYDALLNRFAQLGIENTYLEVGTYYCDYEVHDYLINELGWTIYDFGLGENCGDNILSGTILYDEDNDGCNASDIPMSYFMINGNNGTYNFATTVNTDGTYSLNLFNDTYEITFSNLPEYFTVTPDTSSITFTEEESEQEVNFCLTATESIEDLNITLLPVNQARPGFESNYQLVVENIGTQTVANATVTLIFDETLQTFVTATPAATAITTDQLTFNIENILPFENRVIAFTMQTFEPPTVNGGEIVEFTAVVTPADNDNTPDDNTFVIEQEVVNSYDPNDKRVVQGEEILIEQASEYLGYIIRFQNTGTASAITVRIEDVLSEDLDWTTFKPISASHDYAVRITDGNQLEFIFNDINLPHEAADEPGSHGYIAYKIKPITGLQVGDVINGNEAGIYFDYNLPIITNTTTTEIVDPTAATDSFLLNNQLSLYPNPVKDILHIEVKSGVQLKEVKVYNLQGSQLLQLNRNLESINTESLSSGIYLLSIKTDKGSVEYKLIKN